MLSLLGPGIVKALVDSVFGKLADAFAAYQNKQISLEELRSRMVTALLQAFAEVEKSHADALAKTYASFMEAASKSLLLQVVWAAATVSQLLVLVWHQMGIPAVVYFTGHGYPSSGSTVEWAYALVAALLGMGPVVLRTGPASGAGLLDSLKRTIGKQP